MNQSVSIIIPTKTKARPGVQINADDLLDQARKQTGLDDFGDPWFLDPLHALIGFVNREAGLTSADAEPIRHVANMLCDRLKLVDFLKRYPDVEDEKVHVAGIIVAHPRGGSTLTQRLTARSPQLNATYFWELTTPVPLPDEKFGDPSPRIKLGDEGVRQWLDSMPEYLAMHPQDAQYHEEDMQLSDRCFLSFFYSAHFNIPSYLPWLAKQDEIRAYEEFKLFLKVLQYKQPRRQGRKWLLKSAHHSLCLNMRTMFKVFPETKAIITHRRMDQVIPSLSSAQSVHIRSSGTDCFDKTELGPRLAPQFDAAIRDIMQLRQEMPADKFIDVQYRNTVTKPIDSFRHILERMGLTVTPEDIHEAETWMAANGRDTHPPHRYKPEDFGVTAAELSEKFKYYHDAYDIIP